MNEGCSLQYPYHDASPKPSIVFSLWQRLSNDLWISREPGWLLVPCPGGCGMSKKAWYEFSCRLWRGLPPRLPAVAVLSILTESTHSAQHSPTTSTLQLAGNGV